MAQREQTERNIAGTLLDRAKLLLGPDDVFTIRCTGPRDWEVRAMYTQGVGFGDDALAAIENFISDLGA